MQDHSENTKRIAKNTLMLYGRMLFSMVVSLYTSRVVLNTLGVVDYGIYGVVGGFVSMFSLISSSLSSAVSRFLTFELGRGDQDRLNKAFSTSLLIHIVLAIAVLVIAETVGVWFVNNKMTIPSDRLYAANWVFQASIFSFTKGSDNLISNGSGIAVADGQCMIIVEQGKVVEVCAEPGEYTYDSSTEPSIFAGSFGESLKNTFKAIGPPKQTDGQG